MIKIRPIVNGNKDKIDSHHFLDRHARVFDKNNIIVRPYEFNQLKGGTVFYDFLYSIGIDDHKYFVFPEKNKPEI